MLGKSRASQRCSAFSKIESGDRFSKRMEHKYSSGKRTSLEVPTMDRERSEIAAAKETRPLRGLRLEANAPRK